MKKALTVGDHGAFIDFVVDDIGPEHQLLAVVVVQADGVPQAWHQGHVHVTLNVQTPNLMTIRKYDVNIFFTFIIGNNRLSKTSLIKNSNTIIFLFKFNMHVWNILYIFKKRFSAK